MKKMSFLFLMLIFSSLFVSCMDKTAKDEKALNHEETVVKEDEAKLQSDEAKVEDLKEEVGEDEYKKAKNTMNGIQE